MRKIKEAIRIKVKFMGMAVEEGDSNGLKGVSLSFDYMDPLL